MPFDARTPPTKEELSKAATLSVKDEQGHDVKFGDLAFGNGDGSKTIVLFIRHFHCGMCQDYVSYLTQQVKPDLLQQHNVKLMIVGCGDYQLIKPYRDMLQLPYPLYADPSKKLYEQLGMTLRTLDGGAASPEYQSRGTAANVFGSILRALKMGNLFTKAGDIKQLGGEFVFDGMTPVYTHRMENTRGHAPLAEMLNAAGINLA